MEGAWKRVRGNNSCDCSILSSLDRSDQILEFRIYFSTTNQISIELRKTKETNQLSLWAIKNKVLIKITTLLHEIIVTRKFSEFRILRKIAKFKFDRQFSDVMREFIIIYC